MGLFISCGIVGCLGVMTAKTPEGSTATRLLNGWFKARRKVPCHRCCSFDAGLRTAIYNTDLFAVSCRFLQAGRLAGSGAGNQPDRGSRKAVSSRLPVIPGCPAAGGVAMPSMTAAASPLIRASRFGCQAGCRPCGGSDPSSACKYSGQSAFIWPSNTEVRTRGFMAKSPPHPPKHCRSKLAQESA